AGARRDAGPILPARGKLKRRPFVAESIEPQSIGSTFTIEAPWLLPTQNVTGLVELSTNTRRILVVFGSRYSTNSPVLGFSRETRSLSIEPVKASPFLSLTTS